MTGKVKIKIQKGVIVAAMIAALICVGPTLLIANLLGFYDTWTRMQFWQYYALTALITWLWVLLALYVNSNRTHNK